MSAVRASVRWLRRSASAGELNVTALAIIVAVASVASLGIFTERVRSALTTQANELLGADLVVLSSDPIDEALEKEARSRGLSTARTTSFRSAVLAAERLQLVEVKAVSERYPLRGQLTTADLAYGPGRAAAGVPQPGSVWIDSQLAGLLEVQVGDTLELGRSTLRIAAILVEEPDRGAELFNIAPRLLMSLADLPATALIRPGSRVSYRLLVAGPGSMRFREWLLPRLGRGERLQSVQDVRPELRTTLERGERFLRLSALIAVILGGLAVAVSGRRFAERNLDAVAVMRCLGARQSWAVQVFGLLMLWLALGASAAGCALGYLAQAALVEVLAGMLPSGQLPPPGLGAFAVGIAVGVILFLGFALPPVLRLRSVPPLRVLRRDLGPSSSRAWAPYAIALLGVTALATAYSGDLRLALYLLGGVLAAILVFIAAALALIWAVGRLRVGLALPVRHGLAGIVRRPLTSAVQIVSFSLGLMVLLLLSFVREDLLSAWRERLPLETPNFFVINVQPEEVEPLRAFFRERGLPEPELYPMVRGRLVAIDGRSVSADDYEDPRAKRLVEREFNLSWAADLGEDNRIVAGSWWSGAAAAPGATWSVEEGLAETLGIRLHDRLRFTVGADAVEGEVASLRSVQWDSFRANFFVLARPGQLEGFAVTFITSFYLPEARRSFLVDLVRTFPSVSILDVDVLLGKVREVVDRVALVLDYVLAFTLLAGLLVVLAIAQATEDERLYESAILRFLGASRSVLRSRVLVEFLLLGSAAGVLAAAAAAAVGHLVAEHLLGGLALRFNPWLWLSGTVLGIAGVGAAGLLGARRVARQPVAETLRRF